MTRRLNVGVLDDDLSVCKALASLMRVSGYAAVTYASPTEFLERYLEDQLDILITDYQMPGMTGIDVLKRLRADGSDLPVIVITAFLQSRIADASRVAGAVACFRKPIDHTALLAIIQRAADDLE